MPNLGVDVGKVTTKVTEFTDIGSTKLVAVEAAKTSIDATVTEWQAVWKKLPKDRKKYWLEHNLVPVISKSYQTYLALKTLFGEVDDDQK